MTHAQALHMVAAAVLPMPEHLKGLHERLRGQLNAVPCAPRRETLELARESFRLAEYFEARHGELPLLGEVIDRLSRGQSVDRQLTQLDAYWLRMRAWIEGLGPNPSPVMAPQLPPHPDSPWAWAESQRISVISSSPPGSEATP